MAIFETLYILDSKTGHTHKSSRKTGLFWAKTGTMPDIFINTRRNAAFNTVFLIAKYGIKPSQTRYHKMMTPEKPLLPQNDDPKKAPLPQNDRYPTFSYRVINFVRKQVVAKVAITEFVSIFLRRCSENEVAESGRPTCRCP
jgi:hypothetical protein